VIEIRPSGAGRWVPCPGSPKMESRFPKTPKHETTQEGTAIHWACERVLMSWLPWNAQPALDLETFLGIKCPENDVILTDDMLWGGGLYLETVWAVARQDLTGLMVEQQVPSHEWMPGCNGRADTAWKLTGGTHLEVLDFKWGRGAVPARQNWQLIIYARGLLGPNTQTVRLTVAQPRVSIEPDTVTYTRAELLNLSETVRLSHQQASTLDAPPTRAGKHCRYCRAAGSCGTLGAAGLESMEHAGYGVDVNMSEARIAFELEAMERGFELIQARRDGLAALAESRILASKVIPGYGRKTSLSNRFWTKDAAALRVMAKLLYGIEIGETKLCTPNKATGRGLPKDFVAANTDRRELAAKLVRTDPDAARRAFNR